MDGGAVELLRGALLLTPPGRMFEASQVLQSLTQAAEDALVQSSAEMLGTGLTDPVDIHVATVHAYARHRFGPNIMTPLDGFPTDRANPDGRWAALDAIARTERENLGSFNRMMSGDPEALELYQNAIDEAIANPEGPATETTPPVDAGPTSGQVRVTGEQCRPIRICFWPGAKFRSGRLRREYERQLRHQEAGINAMDPAQLVSNRDARCNPATRPGIEALKASSTAAVRRAYERAYQSGLRARARLLPSRVRAAALLAIPARVRRHMNRNAILHNPDVIAGGNPVPSISAADAAAIAAGRPSSIAGQKEVNSSIGRLWGTCASRNSRSSRLRDHAERQAANGCSSVQADLAICND